MKPCDITFTSRDTVLQVRTVAEWTDYDGGSTIDQWDGTEAEDAPIGDPFYGVYVLLEDDTFASLFDTSYPEHVVRILKALGIDISDRLYEALGYVRSGWTLPANP